MGGARFRQPPDGDISSEKTFCPEMVRRELVTLRRQRWPLGKGTVMHRFASRLGKSIALTAALGLATATTAAAHECYNASRSDQGNLKAGTQSNTWFTLVVADIIAEEVAGGLYDEATGECVLAAYEAEGGLASFTIKVVGGKDGLIAGGVTNHEILADGTGIDHIFAAYGETIIGAYASCGVEF